jgi:hypothetical protein
MGELPVASCRLLVVGYWLSVVGFWFLDAGTQNEWAE